MKPCPESQSYKMMRLNETDSTSSYLRKLCQTQPVDEFTTVVADFQTAGRGQRGNSWESEKGKNLLFSFVLYPAFMEARSQFLLSQIVSLAIKEELSSYADGFSIKWPNDIYWKEKKICGILIENDLTGKHISQSIAGIGINLNQKEFRSNAPNPVSLHQITGEEYDTIRILNNIITRTREYYHALKRNDCEAVAEQYRRSLFRGTGLHRYADAEGVFSAGIYDIESEGTLVLKDENDRLRRYAFKEVQFLL